MKHFRFMLGFLTGAIVVYLFFYRPLYEKQNEFQSVLDEASRRMTAFQAQQEAEHPYLHRNSLYPDYPKWEDIS